MENKAKPDNMWDAESHSYSLMTLMEERGTNLQLDCIPLAPTDTVLDCGCGPGRVAIQAAKRVKKVICLDSSEGMLNECRKNCAAAGASNVEFLLADWQIAEIGKDVPEVDVIIQSRGGGGPTTLEKLRACARKYAVTVMWSEGAPNIPTSRQKLFTDCYTQEAMQAHPELLPPERRPAPTDSTDNAKLFGGRRVDMQGKLPFRGKELCQKLQTLGIEAHLTAVKEGWERSFATKQEAYDWLLQLSRHPELVDREQFARNVDACLTQKEAGWQFFLPTCSDVTWFKTR